MNENFQKAIFRNGQKNVYECQGDNICNGFCTGGISPYNNMVVPLQFHPKALQRWQQFQETTMQNVKGPDNAANNNHTNLTKETVTFEDIFLKTVSNQN